MPTPTSSPVWEGPIKSSIAKLARTLQMTPQEVEKNLSRKLVDLGVDSLRITILQGSLLPAPTLLELYNATLLSVLELAQKNVVSADIFIQESTSKQVVSRPAAAAERLRRPAADNSGPFKLMEMQESYFIGRYESERFCPCQVYNEFDFASLDLAILERALRHVVTVHPMLRARVVGDQQQRVRDVTDMEAYLNIRVAPVESDLSARRRECSEAFKLDPNCHWKIEATALPGGGTRLHVLLDMLFLDASSSFLVCREVVTAYNALRSGVPVGGYAASLTFPEYCAASQGSSESETSRGYWAERIDNMPGPPQLPRAKVGNLDEMEPFKRVTLSLGAEAWLSLKGRAAELQVTPTALLLGAFYEVLRSYSDESDFTLTITISDRQVGGMNFADVVGDFTNVLLCSLTDEGGRGDFPALLRRIHADLAQGLQHKDMGGLKVMRLLREKRGDPNFILPVVFTSLLGLDATAHRVGDSVPTMAYQQTQTPQVWLDHQVYELGAELRINWDYDTLYYTSELMEEMMGLYRTLLERLSTLSLEAWSREATQVNIPLALAELRRQTNSTERHFESEFLLHRLFDGKRAPEKIAIIDQEVKWTYRELDSMVDTVAGLLQESGVQPGHLVAIVMEKGWEQVVAVLGILRAGGAYLPINPSDPDNRISAILERSSCEVVLSQSKVVAERAWKSKHHVVFEISSTFLAKNHRVPVKVVVDLDSVAYVIFTSGTEGAPKGVEIPHRGAVNTCVDINSRFGVTASDTAFGISSLSFDLSVWDIFGVLGAGGTLVICKPSGTRDPAYWWSQLRQHSVTVWNTVPTSFEMLMETLPTGSDAFEFPLKTVLLSGDAIKMEFVRYVKQTYPQMRLICMGGATEASIWSNHHEIIPCRSPKVELVPYGVPLSNQTMYVLDSRGLYRQTDVVGTIHIGGVGVAKGYFKDPVKTAEKFWVHPVFGKLYDTGDVGRYLPNGEIQIIGRRDAQVKVGGHRVELAEIEHCAEQVPYVKRAAVVCTRGFVTRLVGFVELHNPQPQDLAQVERELRQRVAATLPDYMATQTWIVLPQIPLSANGKVDRKRLAVPDEISNQGGAAVDDVLVRRILRVARELLDDTQQRLAPTSSLIEFGMTSLAAIRFSKKLADELGIQLPYTLVFNYPTVINIADMISGRSADEVAKLDAVVANGGSEKSDIPIAVVGMACRLPGGVTNPKEFWAMLAEGRDCTTDVPKSRFDIDEIYHPVRETIGKSYTKRGAFIKDVEWFDHDFFNISLAEARSMDPQQRILLEVAYEAFIDAGLDKRKLSGSNTGVFVGQMNYDWMLVTETQQTYAGTGISPSISANRVSFALGLRGPSMTVDTACSSSLVAVDLAVEKLKAGKCTQALVGGVNIMLHPEPYLITCAAEMLSMDGRCATFDAKANGIARGEGVGCVVLKRLDQARADGDQILALIRGTAVNQDGRSATLTAPSGHAQEAVILGALREAGLTGKDVDYVECHGTGTNLGDPIEVEALSKVLGVNRDKPVVLGAVKTNIGHLEGAAGITGLIKTILVLQHGEAPPNIHFKTLNPKINLDKFKAVIPTKAIKLYKSSGHGDDDSAGHQLIAGISSFGFGGTNAHAILQSYHSSKEAHKNVVKSNGAPIKLFKRVHIPWKLPSIPSKNASKIAVDGDQESGGQCLFEINWIILEQSNVKLNKFADSASFANSRWLVLSFSPVSTTGTNWVNVVHAPDAYESMNQKPGQDRQRHDDLRMQMDVLLKEEAWKAIVLVASDGETMLMVDIGLRLLQAACKNTSVPDIWFLTQPQSKRAAATGVDYSGAGLWALARTARIELPEVRLRCVESNTVNAASDIVKLCHKVTLQGGQKENAFRIRPEDGTLEVERLRRMQQDEVKSNGGLPISVRKNVTYVISGGLGSLGMVVAGWLVKSGATHIVVLSRTKRTSELSKLEALGQETIKWIKCDVSSLKEVQRIPAKLSEMQWPRVGGLIHAAGILSDRTIANLDAAALAETFGAKVDGARNLHSTLSPSDFTLLFSSVGVVFGAPGQANYAAASATMDAMAKAWRNNGETVLSVQWGAWSEGGMAANPATLQDAERRGLGSVTNAFAVKMLKKLFAEPKTGVVCVSPVNWEQVEAHDPLLSGWKESTLPCENDAVACKPSSCCIPSTVTIGSEAKPQKSYSEMEVRSVVTKFASEVLGSAIPDTAPLMEAGMSSLALVSLRHYLSAEFSGVSIPNSVIFNYPTIKDLAAYIHSQLTLPAPKPTQPSKIPSSANTNQMVAAKNENEVTAAVKKVVSDVLGSAIPDTAPLMEAGMSSLALVSLRHYLSAEFSGVSIPNSVIFNYPTIKDLASYIYGQLVELNSKLAPTPSAVVPAAGPEWQKLNNRLVGRPVFLIGGVLGTASGTFEKLAHQLPSPVFALVPDLSPEDASVKNIAAQLIASMRKIQPEGKYIMGGLSFGAVIALEMACQLEEHDMVEVLLMLDPRHTPPFTVPSNPAKFESLVAAYTPGVMIHSPVALVQTPLPNFAALSPLLKEAARSFQPDDDVERNCRRWCSRVTIVNCPGHHFKFLNLHPDTLAQSLLKLPINWQEKNDEEKEVKANDPIAIVGMACRLPGGVSSPEEFWSMLSQSRDCVTEVPMSRFDMDDVFSPDRGTVGKSYTKKAAFMEDVEWFDHEIFNISQAEANAMDPQQRLLLEVAYEAFYRAGYDMDRLKGTKTGVFIGQANYDWMTSSDGDNTSPYYGAGTSAAITSNRISYVLGLQGPSMTMDTACSSSLVALNAAVEKVKSGSCSVALVAGVNVILGSKFFVTSSATQALSHAGRCASFDASADGYCRGEGVGCVVLKRLSQAKADGDVILALIKGTAVNHDGRSASLTAPNGFAQQSVIRSALAESGIKGKDIDYVECHGTGTELGDPIEVDALKSVLGEGRSKPVVLGAVKTNIGHLEGAAGVTGLIKAILVLQHKVAPPNLHFKKLNSNIDLTGFDAVIPTSITPLRDEALYAYSDDVQEQLLAGVSSFGFGGTNAHAVLQEWPEEQTEAKIRTVSYNRKFLPWHRLPHPLIYNKASEASFVGRMSGERAKLWDDHCIRGEVWFPAASHLTMVAGAVLETLKDAASNSKIIELQDVMMARPMLVSPNMEVRCTLIGQGAEIESESNDVKHLCVRVGQASMSSINMPQSGLDEARSRCRDSVDIKNMYEQFESLGAQFGPSFRNIAEAWQGNDEAVARISLAKMSTWERSLSLVHPAILDGAFQLLSLCSMKTSGMCVPFHVDRVMVTTQHEQEDLWAHVRLRQKTSSSLTGDVVLTTGSGSVVAVVEGLTSRRGGDTAAIDCLYETEWIPLPPRSVSSTQAGQLTESDADKKSLLISFFPVSTDDANWVNVVHKEDSSSTNEQINSVRYVDLMESMERILKEKSWKTVILLSNTDDCLLSVQVGLSLLKAVEQLANEQRVHEILFITSPQGTSTSTVATSCPSTGIWALARTARLEMPDIRLKCVEMPKVNSALELSNLCSQISSQAEDVENEFHFSTDNAFHVPRLVRMNPGAIKDGKATEINDRATYVVSGGLGALGLVVARWLVEAGAKHIALLSRSSRASSSAELQQLQAQASVKWLQCDVSSADDVRRASQELKDKHWPVVGGVFHTAGVLSDGTIRTLDSLAFQKPFIPKVDGAKNLHDVFAPRDFIILFSSAAAVFGSAGQANYAAANAVMDAKAEAWRSNGERVLSIQWGAWSEGGMAADKGALKRGERMGFGSITNKMGTELLQFLFSMGKTGVICATPIDWSRMARSALHDHFRADQRGPASASTLQKSITVNKSPEDIRATVQQVAREVLGIEVAADLSLMEAGLDSLGAVEFRNRLSSALGIQLPSIFVYNHPSVSEMVAFLMPQVSTESISLLTSQRTSQMQQNEPIAVIGMSCRLPGDVSSPEEFWTMLQQGRDCVSEVPISRFDMEEVYETVRGAIGKTYTKRAAFMKNVEWFDNDFFNISNAEANSMDPQQRLLIEVAYEAFVRAGYDKARLRSSDTGVFVGQANYDWMTMNKHDIASPYFGAGGAASITSNRVSFLLGLRGPSMTVDTACSSSLVAMDIATEKLRSGKCSLALVAGVNVMLSTLNFVGSCAANMLSYNGRCATFDASADGYCRGEGIGCVVLKPLSRAQADGDNILSVIRGTAVNQDGRSATLTAPNGTAQESVMRKALTEAGLAGKDVDYVECHGTGTDLGDPIEVDAIKNVLGEGRSKPVVLGAVKSNFGHLEGAAGVAGFIKAVLVLQHREAPPIVHFKQLNPKIDLSGFDAVIPTKCTSLDYTENHSHQPIAGISSFGFGGTNAHVIVQAWQSFDPKKPVNVVSYNPKFLPWRQLPHPLIYRKPADNSFVGRMSGERASLWNDHRIGGQVLFPAASHLTMAAGAVLEMQKDSKPKVIELQDVIMIRPMQVKQDMEVKCTLTGHGIEIQNVSDEVKDVCVRAGVASVTGISSLPQSELEGARNRCKEPVNVAEMYSTYSSVGVEFGSTFRNVTEAWLGNDEAVARVSLANMTALDRSLSLIHPAILDGAFQVLGLCAMKTSGICVPFHIERVVVAVMHEQEDLWAHVHLRQKTASSLVGDVVLMNAAGDVVAFVEGLMSRRRGAESAATECLYETEWLPLNHEESSSVVKVQARDASDGDKTKIMEGAAKNNRVADSRCLLISFDAIDTKNTNWVNVVHAEIATAPSLNNSHKDHSRSADLRISLETLLKEETWESVLFVGTSEDALLTLEVGLAVLKEVEKLIRSSHVPSVWFLTTPLAASAASTGIDNSGAGLWAMARTARLEIPELLLRCVECAAASYSAAEIAEVCSKVQIRGGAFESEFRIRQRLELQVSRLVRMSPKASDQVNSIAISKEATYVISGGVGALARVVTAWLVKAGATHIALLSRNTATTLPADILKLRETAAIEWIQCDVSSSDDVRKVQETLKSMNWPMVRGVVHTAGVLADGTIRTLDSDAMRKSYAPKVDGARNLHNVFAPSDFLVLYSSAAATFGSPAQANYAAANATMDAMAKAWRNKGETVLSIQWGAWSEGGMALLDKSALKRSERQGFGAITNTVGMQILQTLLEMPKTGVVCATPIEWSRVALKNPLLSNFQVNSLKASSSSMQTKITLKMNEADVLTMVRHVVQDVLGSAVADDAPLMEAGMDSLSAVEFRNRLSAELGVNLPSIFVYNHPTLSDMVAALVPQLLSTPSNTTTSKSTEKNTKDDPIAVIGMACRLPGGVTSPEEFWTMLQQGRDCVTDIPASRFDMSDVYDPVRGKPGKSYTNRGAFMKDVDWFDHDFFNISHSEAKRMDPQQRLLLEVGYEAFVRAGYDKLKLKGSETGVFVGQMNYDWMLMNGNTPSYGGTGFAPAISANRLSYIFGLRGPSMTIDTACSSSLVALDSAVEKLQSGKCSLALVAGVNVMLQAVNFVGTSQANMLSIEGRCATFDAGADGYCKGEGVGCVVLKHLSKALADGDTVLALIKGTAVNQDGRSASLTAPNGPAQESVINSALSAAGLSGKDVDYVECHGTGTELGDPIEVEALKNVLGQGRIKPVVLGAVKTNIGHLEGAAGVAGLIKTVLVLQHGEAPPNIHFKTLNPKIDIKGFEAVIPTKSTSLKSTEQSTTDDGAATFLAGISSFGFGGSNAHAILQSWPAAAIAVSEQTFGPVAWLFTGQGSQFPGMGRDLYKSEESFKSALDLCAEHLSTLVDVPLLELLFNETQKTRINETRYSQPAIISLEYALSEMWRSKGVTPSLVLGHSIGEFAAAVACGVMGIKDALTLVAARGQLMDQLCERGAMAAVFAPSMKIKSKLSEKAAIAAINGPTLTVISGTRSALDETLGKLNLPSTFLPVEHGFHSPLMNSMLGSFKAKFEGVDLREPSADVTFVSTVTGTVVGKELTTSEYWVNQVAQPVNFLAAMVSTHDVNGDLTYIEIGPKPILIPMAKRFVSLEPHRWMTTEQRHTVPVSTGKQTKSKVFPKLFNRKHLPWNSTAKNSSTRDIDQEIPASDCLYETVWEDINATGSSDNTHSPGSVAESRCLILSLVPVKVNQAQWLNVVHADKKSENGNIRQANLFTEMKNLLKEQAWDDVMLLSAGGEMLPTVELGLQLLKALEKHSQDSRKTPDVWFITTTSAKEDTGVESSWAGLLALARTARMEISSVQLRCVECSELLHDASEIASFCDAVLSKCEHENEIKIDKDGAMQVSRLVRMKKMSDEEPAKLVEIKPETTYVISGGLGALAQVVATWLVDSGATHIALLSRTKRAEQPKEITELLKRGSAHIEWIQCDVSVLTDVSSVKEKLAELNWPPVTGVFHTAGVLLDGTISTLDPSKLSKAFSPKVDGARNLHEIFYASDFFMLFSSAAAVFGSPGQANYAAANATMDAMAEAWRRKGERVLSIQWGAWSEGGMAADKGALKRAERNGFGAISNKRGLEILQELIAAKKLGVVCATPISWSRMKLAMPMLQKFMPKKQMSKTISSANKAFDNDVDVISIVRQVALEVLGAEIPDDAALVEAGMDSLGAVEFRNQLAAKFDIQLPAAILFDFPSIATLSAHFRSLLKSNSPAQIPRSIRVSEHPTLIIGAGMGGLGFARTLLRSGERVVIMESQTTIGGVWKTLANNTSKLQIDAPSYDFGCIDPRESKTWPSTFPSRAEVLTGAEEVAASLLSDNVLLMNTRVEKVTKVGDTAEYLVDYTRDGASQQMRVSGVVALMGGLHKPRLLDIPGEAEFGGKCRLGISNDVEPKDWVNSSVVIVGHGAFAVENLRTALENGARHVTIVCRKRNLVFSSVVNWLLNTADGNMPMSTVLEALRPLYASTGVDITTLPCFTRDNGDIIFDQQTVPPSSDIYFLAQILGRLEVIEDEVERMTENCLFTKGGRQIHANIVLKCLGFHTDESIMRQIFGKDFTVEGLWINGDANLMTFRDGGHISRRVRSLLCSSYLFYIQAFAPAYAHFRNNENAFRVALESIREVKEEEVLSRTLVQIWDFLAPAKKQLAERTRRICPFDVFQRQREREWNSYLKLLAPAGPQTSMWNLLQPTLDEVRRRDPQKLVEERAMFEDGDLVASVYRPLPRHRVLFLHGQGTDAAIAHGLLERSGWAGQFVDRMEFIVPDAPHKLPAFTNAQQLGEIGLQALVEEKIYDKDAVYREWGADYGLFAEIHHGRTTPLSKAEIVGIVARWKRTLGYLKHVIQKYGPFDGIAGFCEGAATASVALHLQAAWNRGDRDLGMDLGLGGVKFLIAMAPWRNPYYATRGLYGVQSLPIPSLHITGRDDMKMFRDGFATFCADFKASAVFEHGGKHVYPIVSPSLKVAVGELLSWVQRAST